MSWCAGCLSFVLAAAPPSVQSGARRFNTEPVVLAATGAIAVAFSAWRFVVADGQLAQLDLLSEESKRVTTQADAVKILGSAREAAFIGNAETSLGGVLALMGAAFIITGVIWFLVEGRETTDWLTVRY
ncbi:MAG: hypothetical protein Q8N26_09135 [Myxococcales bacterium]|nr:hypothetical protein [Myxococcales bacterium]